MRPVFVGFALVWIFSTVVTSFRMMVNAPGIFLLFLVPPAIVLYYGLTAEEPKPKADLPRQPPANCIPPDSVLAMLEPATPLLPEQQPALDLSTLPPITRTLPPPPPGVQEPAPMFLPKQPPYPEFFDALRYAAAAMTASLKRAVLLLLATLLLIPLSGYLVRVLKGADPAPEVSDWAGLLMDGIKLILIIVLYAIPAVALLILLYRSYNDNLGIAIVILFLYLLPSGILRFARTGSVASAFGVRHVIGQIFHIGLIAYTGFFLLWVVLNIGIIFVYRVPYAGLVLMVMLIPPLALFEARYLALLYDRSGT
jgi:hypothetical protein